MSIARLVSEQRHLTAQLQQARDDGDNEAIEQLEAELEENRFAMETLEDDASMDRGRQGWR